jgi:tetratricopeptide (TPR) repeat protein
MLRVTKNVFLPFFSKTNSENIVKTFTRNNSSIALTTNVEWSKMLEDIEKSSSFFKTIGYNAPKKSVEKVKKDAEQFMVDVYESALKEGQAYLQNFKFSNAMVIFDKIIESVPELNVKNRALNRILSEAYAQGGIILYKGGIKDNEKAFEYFKIAAGLNPKNELAKEKLSEMKYERGEISGGTRNTPSIY